MPIAIPSTTAVTAQSTPSPTSPSYPLPATTTSASSAAPRNPVRLNVTQRDNSRPWSTEAGPSTPSPLADEQSTLRRAAVRKVQLQRRTQKWMDRLMEETVDRSTFKRATTQFTPSQYLEITHERHLNSLCSYPPCPNPPLRPYSTAKRFVISTRARTIKPKEGNEEDGYCSKRCTVRSSWVERRLSDEAVWLRTNAVEVKLLEEMEESGEFVWEGDNLKPRESLVTQSEEVAAKELTKPVVPTTPARAEIIPTNPVTALIASLAIHERPTPLAPPTPPSLNAASPKTAHNPPSPMIAQPKPLAQATTPVKSPSSRDSRRTSSAIISGPTSQLASTLVSATKSVGPVQQLEADSEEERDESDWEKDMAWGEEDDEIKALFEEARLARELVEEE